MFIAQRFEFYGWRGSSGIVEEEIEPTENPFRLIEQGGDRIWVGDIRRYRQGFAAAGFYFSGNRY